MNILRTRLKNGLIAEFLPPKTESRRVVVICDGLPTVPSKKGLMEFLSKHGFWVFHLRYGGTWESEGIFLKHSPHRDVLYLLSQIKTGITDIWGGGKYKVKASQVIVVGASFGGTCALLCSLDKRVDKVVSICPVIDWREMKKTSEPIPVMFRLTKLGFGPAYRPEKRAAEKLASGKFFNPINHITEFNGSKVMLIQAMDDDLVAPQSTKKFAKEIGAKFISFKKGGHLSSRILGEPKVFKEFKKFLKQKTAK